MEMYLIARHKKSSAPPVAEFLEGLPDQSYTGYRRWTTDSRKAEVFYYAHAKQLMVGMQEVSMHPLAEIHNSSEMVLTQSSLDHLRRETSRRQSPKTQIEIDPYYLSDADWKNLSGCAGWVVNKAKRRVIINDCVAGARLRFAECIGDSRHHKFTAMDPHST